MTTLSDSSFHLIAARRALSLTARLIDELGPRPSASTSSRAAADALRGEAGTFAEETWSEDFPVHPGAFLGWIRLLVFFYAIAVGLLWLRLYLAAALLTTASLVIMVAQFFLYRELLDPLFPRRTGRNVWAAVNPSGEARGQLIVSGHHDSARVFNFLIYQPRLYPLRVIGGIGTLALLLLVSWILFAWTVIAGAPPGWGGVAAGLFSLLLLLVGQLWWFASSQSTPGAGDNLASSAAAWEVLRAVANHKAAGNGPRHLRVVAASWDAEEAGLRGSRHWVKNGSDGRLNHPTWNLNLECLYNADDFFLLTSDINGSVQLSAAMARRCRRLLADGGRQAPTVPIAFLTGGTDAAELAKGGAQATTLMGMPWGNQERSSAYHTPGDVVETVGEQAIAEAIELALKLAWELDQELADDAASR